LGAVRTFGPGIEAESASGLKKLYNVIVALNLF
jgi:hypothetical protein